MCISNDAVKERIASVVQTILNSFVIDIGNNLNQHNAKFAVNLKPGDNINLMTNNQALCTKTGCDESRSLYFYASDKSYRWYLFMNDKQPFANYKLYSEVGNEHNATITLANTANVSIYRITCRDNQAVDNWRECYHSTENRYQTIVTSPQSNLNSYDLAIAQHKYHDSFIGDMIF